MEQLMLYPVFTSNYSFGKSIITLDDPSKTTYPIGAESAIKLAQQANLPHLTVVDSNPFGLAEARKRCKSAKLKLIFGLRLVMVDSLEPSKDAPNSEHNLIVFAKNSDGYRDLLSLYKRYSSCGEKITYAILKSLWTPNLVSAIPFYDSFLHINLLTCGRCVPDLSFLNPTFFIEDNELPFDHILQKSVISAAAQAGAETLKVKSIYYVKRDDFDAYVTYRIACSRTFGKSRTLGQPNIDHLASREFCWQSYLEQCNG